MGTAEDDFEENYERPYRDNAAARTLYHSQRADNDTLNSTRSLYDPDTVYTTLYGRRYCKDYYMPNDEEEQTRTQILHEVFFYLLGQRLTTVPLDNPQKILDIGTGTGEWAMAIADEYPEAEIIGTDIAKIQPTATPLNVFFEIDDAEEEGGWTFAENEFDFIHCRSMAGAFKDWRYIYTEAFRHLKPGGWIEVMDFDDHRALMSYFVETPEVKAWLDAVGEATRISGRSRSSTHLEPESLTKLGFVDVKSETKTIPFGIWQKDPEAQKIGKHFLVTQLCGIEAISMRPLVESQGWDIEDVRRTCRQVTDIIRSIALDPEKGVDIGMRMNVLVGRKPSGTAGDGSPAMTGMHHAS